MAEPDPLAEMEFLARSPNRIAVLAALVKRTRTRQELAEAVDVSQPTLGRILDDLTERHWVRADGDAYSATATGEHVAAGLTDLRKRLEAEARLRPVVEWLPTDAIDVGIGHLGDATITTPSQTRPNAPIRRMLNLIRETDNVLLFSHAFNEQKLRLVRDRTVEGDLTTEGVFTETAIETIADIRELRDLLADIVASDRGEIRVSAAEIPVAVEVTDTRTHLLLRDDKGIVRTALDTDDPAVRQWAEELHERYWTEATPVTPETLAE